MRNRIRHPGDKVFQFSLYLSCNNVRTKYHFDQTYELQLWLDYFRNSVYNVETSEPCMGFNYTKLTM